MTVDLHIIDPAHPDAIGAMQSYFAELDALFPTGFDPGPITDDDLSKMRPPSGAFLLAYRGAMAVGCVGLRRDPDGWGEVKRLWVAPDARGIGLADRLMSEIEAQARLMGLRLLRLDTNGVLTTAIRFYRHRGWSEIARYNDNPYAEHFFEKAL